MFDNHENSAAPGINICKARSVLHTCSCRADQNSKNTCWVAMHRVNCRNSIRLFMIPHRQLPEQPVGNLRNVTAMIPGTVKLNRAGVTAPVCICNGARAIGRTTMHLFDLA